MTFEQRLDGLTAEKLLAMSPEGLQALPRFDEEAGERNTRCVDCVDCEGCTRCLDCEGCMGCVDCEGCKGCEDCESCKDCEDCVDCMGLLNAADLRYVAYGVQLTAEQWRQLVEKGAGEDEAAGHENLPTRHPSRSGGVVQKLARSLLDCCLDVEAVGDWGERKESYRVCDSCGGAAPVEAPEKQAHQSSCPFGAARAVLEAMSSESDLEALRRILAPCGVAFEDASEGMLCTRLQDGTRMSFLCGEGGRLNGVVLQHGPDVPELRTVEVGQTTGERDER